MPKKEAGIGHNSGDATEASHTVAAGQLRAFCERIERLVEEKKTIAEDIKEVKAEAKAVGFDMTALNEMLKLRAMDKAERDERETLRDLYATALGIFG
jgi:uncharacterized protein (UPF0335 family)